MPKIDLFVPRENIMILNTDVIVNMFRYRVLHIGFCYRLFHRLPGPEVKSLDVLILGWKDTFKMVIVGDSRVGFDGMKDKFVGMS